MWLLLHAIFMEIALYKVAPFTHRLVWYCKYTQKGGGVYSNGTFFVSMRTSYFDSNIASLGGNAFYAETSTVGFSDNTFNNS